MQNTAALVVPLVDDLEKKILFRDNEEFKIVKKLPKRFPTRAIDIYITNKNSILLS